MRDISAANYDALQSRQLVARDFIWFVVRDMTSGDPVTDGYWSDIGDISADIIDPDTGGTETRTFVGAGSLISISDIPLVSNLTVQNITVTLSQVADRVNELVLRGYDCKQGRVESLPARLFDPLTGKWWRRPSRVLSGLSTRRRSPRRRGRRQRQRRRTLTCTSNTLGAGPGSTPTRDPTRRSNCVAPGDDDFFTGTSQVVGTWQHFWGRAGGSVVRSNTGPNAIFKPISWASRR